MSKTVPSLRLLRALRRLTNNTTQTRPAYCLQLPQPRTFHSFQPLWGTKYHKLTDVGEGTKEVEIIQWYVEEGARVEEWAKLCEVQSDKATVDITSPFAGVVKKLHFNKDEVAQVGDVMVTFEVEGMDDDEAAAGEHEEGDEADEAAEEQSAEQEAEPEPKEPEKEAQTPPEPTKPRAQRTWQGSLATPAVRGLLKEHNIAIEDVEGTGRDGRVLKEDVHKFLAQRDQASEAKQAPARARPSVDTKQQETPQKLTPVQAAMFKTMTASLNIPHFLYSDQIDISELSAMRQRLNAKVKITNGIKLSYLPFAIKAVSLALEQYPLLNARVDTSTDAKKPQVIMRSIHNIGIAMDTPGGLVVPVIKGVNSRSVLSLAEELQRLSQLGQAGKLTNDDFSGGTITVSNIGSIGGEVVAPVIVEGQLAIMGMGKVKAVPVFAEDGLSVIKAEMMGVSWSADHRVVDGATMARMAKVVQGYLERPESMLVEMA